MTPINWHLTPEEVAYIVDNCEAKVLIAEFDGDVLLDDVQPAIFDDACGDGHVYD